MGGGNTPITFVVEDWENEIREYTIPHQMTWGEFINSEYNTSLQYKNFHTIYYGEYFKEFIISEIEIDGKSYVQYRESTYECADHYMLHVYDWEYIYIDELIEPKRYTNR